MEEIFLPLRRVEEKEHRGNTEKSRSRKVGRITSILTVK